VKAVLTSIETASGRFKAWLSSWRLPVRIPVPNRDNLIAMGLMSLAMGLIVGVAIGPGLGSAGNAIAGIAAPPVTSTPEEEVAEEEVGNPDPVELGTPAGSESLASTDSTGPSTADTGIDDLGVPAPTPDVPDEPVDPREPVPANDIEPDPDTPIEDEPEAEDGTELKGAVVGVDTNGKRFSVADSSGNVLVLFGQDLPSSGDAVRTRILPLANGTFAETGERKVSGIRSKSKLRGIVSWFDPVTRLAVISSRGSSLAVDLTAIPEVQEPEIGVGSPVEGAVAIAEPVEAVGDEPARPGLIAEELEATGETIERIEMSGKLEAIDETGRILVLAADSNGLIPAGITIMTPKKFPFETVSEGKAYDVSANRGDDGMLTLTGLSPGYGKSSADDAEAAFGDHG